MIIPLQYPAFLRTLFYIRVLLALATSIAVRMAEISTNILIQLYRVEQQCQSDKELN